MRIEHKNNQNAFLCSADLIWSQLGAYSSAYKPLNLIQYKGKCNLFFAGFECIRALHETLVPMRYNIEFGGQSAIAGVRAHLEVLKYLRFELRKPGVETAV